MGKLISVGGALTAVASIGLAALLTVHSGAAAQVLPAAADAALLAVNTAQFRGAGAEDEFMNDKGRYKDYAYAEIGNLRPLIKDANGGVRFQSRVAILYKDGAAKLWSSSQKDPVAPTFRHKGPIRELTFFEGANLLITRSDDSLKLWDALTGEPRKEILAQSISPMWSSSFAGDAKRFVTSDRDGKTFTVWDAMTLAAVATVNPPGGDSAASAISSDGKTVVRFTFGADPSVQLWDVASGRLFATLRNPSRAVVEGFTEKGTGLSKSYVDREGGLWEVVRSLAPAKPSS